MRERLVELNEIAIAAQCRVSKIRNAYLRQLRHGLADLIAATRELEVAAWDE